jgi:hypothetical protein
LVFYSSVNPSNAELNPNCPMLALLGAHHILHVSRIKVNTIVLVYRKIKLMTECNRYNTGRIPAVPG